MTCALIISFNHICEVESPCCLRIMLLCKEGSLLIEHLNGGLRFH